MLKTEALAMFQVAFQNGENEGQIVQISHFDRRCKLSFFWIILPIVSMFIIPFDREGMHFLSDHSQPNHCF